MQWFNDLVPSLLNRGNSNRFEDESDAPVFVILYILLYVVVVLAGVVSVVRNIKEYV